jgi:hypothetical protein
VDGVDYYFVSKPEFLDLIARNELIEHALVYGDYKGVPKKQVHACLVYVYVQSFCSYTQTSFMSLPLSIFEECDITGGVLIPM